MMTRGKSRAKALFLAAVIQRCWLAPCLMAIKTSMACCHVRVAIPVFEPTRYALAKAQVEHRLAFGVVFGFIGIGGLQTGTFAGDGVYAIEFSP
jgi:hypothetical protein